MTGVFLMEQHQKHLTEISTFALFHAMPAQIDRPVSLRATEGWMVIKYTLIGI